MRQKTKEMAAAYEETRPLSDGSAYDDNSIVIKREKHRVQVRFNPKIRLVFFALKKFPFFILQNT